MDLKTYDAPARPPLIPGTVSSPAANPRHPSSIIVLSALLLMSSIFLLGSCSEGSDSPNSHGRLIKIGFSLDSVVVERWERDKEEFITHARSLGAEVKYRFAVADARKQVEDINELLDDGVDALVVVPNDAQALQGVLKRAANMGVPVISYDRLILNSPVSAYVSFDNVEVGRLMAEGLIKHAGFDSKILIINGGSKDNNSRLLRRGISEVLRPYSNRGMIRIVGEITPDDWYTTLIEDELEDYISNYELDGIIAANDLFADSAIQILARYRQAGDVVVVGQDADLIACQRLVEGIQHRTIYKPIDRLARQAAETAFNLAVGETLHSSRMVDNGYALTPSIIVQPIAVEKENLDETVIADGFHSREEVYRQRR